MERNRYVPRRAVHPGEILNEEIKARGMQKKEVAKALGIPQSNLSEYINGTRNFTPEFCVRLERAIPGIKADDWTKLQSKYDLVKARLADADSMEEKALAKENAIGELLNVKELYKRIECRVFTASERVGFLESLLGKAMLNDFTDIATTVSGAYKGSDRLMVDERNQRTWLFLSRLASVEEAKGLAEYTPESGRAFATNLARAINDETLRESDIREMARSCGVGYAVVSNLEKVPVDAYSTWIGPNPVIVASYRHNDLHRLVFDLLHEMGHILLHGGRTFVSLECAEYDKQDGLEREANAFAENTLIPPAIWKKICGEKATIGSALNAVKREAKKNGISPDVALRRYSKESENYRIRGMKRVKIR